MPFLYKHFRVLKSFISAKGPETTKFEKFYYEWCLCQLRRPSDTTALSSNELNLSKHWCLSGCYYQSYFSVIIFIFTLCKQRLLTCFVQAQSWPSPCACNHLKYSLHVENRELKFRDFPLAMHPSFSFTPLLSCCSVAALPMMAPASHIYWKADAQLKWPACLKVSDLQWDSKDGKNVNQLRIFMFDTCCYDN